MPTGIYARTPETRAKMSAAAKKRWESLGYRAKMSAVLKGRKPSPETRAKMSVAHRGKKISPEQCAKRSVAMTGPGNPQWRGGVARLPYVWTFNKELREEVRRRDGYQCQLCGAPQVECAIPLHIHHINYDKRDSDPLNLISLCLPCHSRTGFRREHWTELFQAIAIARDIAALKERKSG